ncbi:MAG: DUF1735 domain-containing protein [Bacteroidales bacterium]|nr:DUF1735 domain-containing protein [Bacteroidales bacterium]
MKQIFYPIAILAAGLAFPSCDDTITVDRVDESAYDNVVTLIGSVRDFKTNKTANVVDLRSEEYNTKVLFTLSRAPRQGVDVKISYDASYLEAYNESHGTSFELFPEAQYSLQNSGEILVAPDETRSYSLNLTLAPFEDSEEKTYLLPLKATVTSGGVKVSEERLVYLVRNMSFQSIVSDDAADRKKVVVFFEVNNTNPLNALQFETEDGHLLIDYLVLFAYNINYDAEKGRVYCFANPQCQYILDHYDEEIRPLRERGIKVIVSVLGNHDAAGCAQLSDAGARAFAKEMAAMCYGYGFDGINLDDEYSSSPDLSVPWFTSRSTAAGNRLYFELKKAMPDKEMMSYQYGSALGNAAVDGIEPGDYMSICVGDYGRKGVAYNGMTLAQCSYQSSEFAQWRYAPTESSVNSFISSDYGYWMIFSLWNDSRNLQRDFNSINYLAKGIYGSDLKTPEKFYPSTRSLESVPINW